jgi:hypothetical protein
MEKGVPVAGVSTAIVNKEIYADLIGSQVKVCFIASL